MNIYFALGSILVCVLVHAIYYKVTKQQFSRMGNVLADERMYDVIEILPECINFVYATTLIPGINMMVCFFFSRFINKLELMESDEELKELLIEAFDDWFWLENQSFIFVYSHMCKNML